MSIQLNVVSIAGNLTRDPVVKMLEGGRCVVEFGLAINRSWKGDDGERKTAVTFVEVEAWGRLAEVIGQYLKKGSGAYFDGRLDLDRWEDKDGKKHHRMKVTATAMQFTTAATGGAAGEVESVDADGVVTRSPAAAAVAPTKREVTKGPKAAAAGGKPATVGKPAAGGDDEPPF